MTAAGGRRALFEAMLLELDARGYPETSLARAAAAAGVSESEAESEFADKDACLFAAYEMLSSDVIERTTGPCDAEASWPQRVRVGLEALLGDIAANPGLARVASRAFPAIRPAAYERYVDLVDRFVPFLREGRAYCEVEEELPGDVELLAVGAAEALIFAEVDGGRAERLPAMMPEILFSILVPFMGPERAAAEMRSAASAQ